jgi:type IVB pilus formation R64 PilN family outer membrane protein
MKAALRTLAVAICLTACSQQQEADKKYDARTVLADQLSAAREAASDSAVSAPIRRSNRHVLGDNQAPSLHGDPLPDLLQGEQGFVLSSGRPLTAGDLARLIHQRTGLPVIIDDLSATGTAPHPQPVAADNSTQTINKLLGASGQIPARGAAVSYAGPLADFLDRELPAFGLDWEFHGGTLYWGHEVVRSYPIVDMNSTTSLSAGLSGASSASGQTAGQTPTSGGATTATSAGATGGGGSGASGGQTSQTQTKFDPWGELLKSLQAFTGGAQDKIFSEPSNGLIRVRCSIYCQGLVSRAIDEHNRTAGRSVLLQVAILTVQRTGSDDYGFNPTILYNNLPTGASLSLLGQATAVATANGSAVTAGVVNAPAGVSSAKFNGTQIAVQAISTNQTVSGLSAKFGVVANNRPLSLRDALDFTFVSSASTSLNTTTSLSEAQLQTVVIGDQLQLIPRLQNDGYIRLQITLSRTSLQSTSTQSLGNGITSTIPQIQEDSSSPTEFPMRDGSTLILSDVSTDTSSNQLSGAGSPYNWLLGGSANITNSKTKIILIVTAREWRPGDDALSPVNKAALK